MGHASTCGIMTYWIGNGDYGNWKISGTYDDGVGHDEARAYYLTDASSGGVMCCAGECTVDGDCTGTNEVCTNTECVCDDGYVEDNNGDCVDIDECQSNPGVCDSNAECENNDGGHECTCNYGYDGDGATCQRMSFYLLYHRWNYLENNRK